MFDKAGIIELHGLLHERLDLPLRHIQTVPDELRRTPISRFGHPSVWSQLVHILTCEEGWVHDLEIKPFSGWYEEDCPTMSALVRAKDRIREASRTYLRDLTEEQLNTTLAKHPVDWGGELRSPAFILLHVITHAFHHKGQVIAKPGWLFSVQTTWLFRWRHRTLVQSEKETFALIQESLSPTQPRKRRP